MLENNSLEIRIADVEESIGRAEELSPKDRARFKLAGWILGSLLLLVLVSAALLAWGPIDRIAFIKEFFSFIKTFVPPMVTLVIGFYFQANKE